MTIKLSQANSYGAYFACFNCLESKPVHVCEGNIHLVCDECEEHSCQPKAEDLPLQISRVQEIAKGIFSDSCDQSEIIFFPQIHSRENPEENDLYDYEAYPFQGTLIKSPIFFKINPYALCESGCRLLSISENNRERHEVIFGYGLEIMRSGGQLHLAPQKGVGIAITPPDLNTLSILDRLKDRILELQSKIPNELYPHYKLVVSMYAPKKYILSSSSDEIVRACIEGLNMDLYAVLNTQQGAFTMFLLKFSILTPPSS